MLSVLVAASQENENKEDVKVNIQIDSFNDPELDGDNGDNVINVDTRKIFSLTDVTLPTPVRTRLTKRRPSSSPSSRPMASSSSRAGSGAAAAKSLRPIVVSTSTLNAALPKGDNSMLNTWFSKLEDAEQHAVSKQSEAERMYAQVGQWKMKFLTLKKEVRNREQVRQEKEEKKRDEEICIYIYLNGGGLYFCPNPYSILIQSCSILLHVTFFLTHFLVFFFFILVLSLLSNFF